MSSYLTVSPLPVPRRAVGGLISVALSRTSPWVAVGHHRRSTESGLSSTPLRVPRPPGRLIREATSYRRDACDRLVVRKGVVPNGCIDILSSTKLWDPVLQATSSDFRAGGGRDFRPEVAIGNAWSKACHPRLFVQADEGPFRMYAVLLSAGLVFLAELGDKSQLMSMTFATRYRSRTVILGAGIACALTNLVSALVGNVIGDKLPEHGVRDRRRRAVPRVRRTDAAQPPGRRGSEGARLGRSGRVRRRRGVLARRAG